MQQLKNIKIFTTKNINNILCALIDNNSYKQYNIQKIVILANDKTKNKERKNNEDQM